MRITSLQLRQLEARRGKKTDAFEDLESDLHGQILDYCKLRGWYVVHSRMDKQSRTAPGVPDMIIAGMGTVFWVECKRKGQKLRVEQQAAKIMLEKNEQRYGVVTTFEEFLEFVRGEL
jgi:hypothetical protein